MQLIVAFIATVAALSATSLVEVNGKILRGSVEKYAVYLKSDSVVNVADAAEKAAEAAKEAATEAGVVAEKAIKKAQGDKKAFEEAEKATEEAIEKAKEAADKVVKEAADEAVKDAADAKEAAAVTLAETDEKAKEADEEVVKEAEVVAEAAKEVAKEAVDVIKGAIQQAVEKGQETIGEARKAFENDREIASEALDAAYEAANEAEEAAHAAVEAEEAEAAEAAEAAEDEIPAEDCIVDATSCWQSSDKKFECENCCNGSGETGGGLAGGFSLGKYCGCISDQVACGQDHWGAFLDTHENCSTCCSGSTTVDEGWWYDQYTCAESVQP